MCLGGLLCDLLLVLSMIVLSIIWFLFLGSFSDATVKVGQANIIFVGCALKIWRRLSGVTVKNVLEDIVI